MLYRCYRFSEWLASWMPQRIAYAIARTAGSLLFLLDRPLRQTLLFNQRRLMPGAPRKAVFHNARMVSICVAKNYYDLFRLPSMSTAQLQEQFTATGVEHLRAAYERGKGVIVVAPHMGSYNLIPAYVSSLGFRSVAVIEHIKDPQLHNYFVNLRANHGLQILTAGTQDVRSIVRALRDGAVVFMLSDRDVGTSTDTVQFWGEETRLPSGPALLARRTGAALIAAYTYRTANTQSVAGAFPEIVLPAGGGAPDERRAQDTQLVTTFMERTIALAPDQWAVLQPIWPALTLTPPPALADAAG